MSNPESAGEAQPDLVHAPEKHRYEIRDGEAVAGFTKYRLLDDTHVDFVHTEVGDKYGGHGLASKLVAFALDDVRSSGKRVIAHCPYVASWIERHDEYADITDPPESRGE